MILSHLEVTGVVQIIRGCLRETMICEGLISATQSCNAAFSGAI